MKKLLLASTALVVSASASYAGGLERTTQSTSILYEDGRYFETSLSFGSPSISGTADLGGGPLQSGDVGSSFVNFGFAYKADLNDTLSYALIYDQPYGANIDYPAVPYPLATSNATFKSHALTAILEYNMPSNVSVYAGLRAQSIEAEAEVNSPAGNYAVVGDPDWSLGYLIGASYEKPEIALRVALTYHSSVKHDLDTLEQGVVPSVTPIEMPQAVNLEFQSGVAEDTLVFGSIRWVDWTVSSIEPANFPSNPLVSFADDRTTYTLGVGRRLNETWSVLGSLSYEETTGSQTGNLAPTDGFKGIALGGVHTSGNRKTTFGVRYLDLGDSIGTRSIGANFTGNHAIGAGIKVGWQF